jgi:hypothetical protein
MMAGLLPALSFAEGVFLKKRYAGEMTHGCLLEDKSMK